MGLAYEPGVAVNLRDAIGIALIAGFLAAGAVLFWVPIPSNNEQLIVYMLGQLSGFVGGVVSYHYVMSKQSERATENTGAAFRAIEASAKASSGDAQPDVVLKPGETAQAEGGQG